MSEDNDDSQLAKQLAAMAKTLELQGRTLETAIARLEETSKFYTEKAVELSRAIDEVLVLSEALKKSLAESDTAIDDLAAITKLQRAMYQAQQDDPDA